MHETRRSCTACYPPPRSVSITAMPILNNAESHDTGHLRTRTRREPE
jgi:hypothetical protein